MKVLGGGEPSKNVARPGLSGLAAVLALVFLSAAAIFAFWYLPRQRAANIDAWSRDLGVRADLRRDALTRHFEDKLNDAVTVSAYPSILAALDAPASPSAMPHVADLLERFVENEGDLGLVLWKADATPLLQTRGILVDAGCRDAARAVLASGRSAIAIHRHEGRGPVVSFSTPVRLRGGPTRGAVTALEDPAVWLYPFLSRPLAGADSGQAALVALENGDVVALSPLPDHPDAPLNVRRPLGTLGFGARAGFEGSEEVAPYTDYRGARVLATGRRLPPSPWVLVTRVDEAEVLSGFRADARKTAASLAAFVLAASALVWGLVQRRERLQDSVLQRSEARFGALLEEANDTILVLDREGRVLDANRRAEAMYGYDRPTLLAKTVADLRIESERNKVAPLLRKAAEEKRFVHESTHRRSDGTTFPVEISTRAVDFGDRPALLSLVRDVSERRRQEDAIRHSEERYRALFDGMLNGFAYCEMLFDAGRPSDFIYLTVNPAFGELTGLADVVGRRVTEVIPGIRETNPEIFEFYGRVAESGVADRLETYVPALGIWFSISAYCPRKGHFVAVFENVTERRNAETALLETQRELAQAQKMEAVGRLAGGVAHDFNNLLTVIRGYGELLAADLEADAPRREELGEILRAADRATGLTRQLLAFSRRQAFEMQALDLGDVVADTEKMLRRLIGEDIHLAVSRPPRPAPVRADRGQIEQVLLNLAVNARDAMPLGGPLAISVSERTVLSALPSTDGGVAPGVYVVLTVADAGCGMSPETLEHAFEPFFTTKETGKGTGLGLSTVFGIVKQSGGHLRVTSAPRAGSTFELFFPRVEEADDTPAPPDGAERGGPETVLVAEDETAVRDLAVRMLVARGYHVVPASSAAEALTRAEAAGTIDLLLTDLVMPGMSGAALAERLVGRRPGLRVLFMSGYPHDVLSQFGVSATEVPLLRKPFTETDLARRVREALDGPAPTGLAG